MKRKVLSVVLAITMLSVTLLGCSSSDSTNEEASTSGETTSGSDSTTASTQEQIELTYYCIPDPEGIVPEKVAMFNEEYPYVTVTVVELPTDTAERLATVSTILQAKDSSLDVFDFDCTYPELFNQAGWLLSLEDVVSDEEKSEFYEASIEANTFNGELYSLPLYIDAGILYYRTDLLEKYGYDVPTTWEEVIEISNVITEQEESITAGLSIAWKQFEGLTCSAIEFLWAYGGNIIDEDGNVVINSDESKAGIEMMNNLENGDSITVDGVQSFYFVESRVPFYSGNTVFLRDWTSAYVGAQDAESSNIVGNVGFTTMPIGSEGGVNYSCLGGWSVGVSAYTEYPDEAKALALYLTSEEGQVLEAIANAKMPSRPAVLENEDVKAEVPYLTEMVENATMTQARPKSAYYAEISAVIQTEISGILAGTTDIDTACESMQSQIEEIVSR
ncbi:MAG: extracellular solute-binding protein [Eubacteriales bacterium]